MAEKTLEEQINELAAKFAPVFEKFAELSVAQTVLLLEQAQMSGKLTQPLTQVDIQAFSQYNMIENAKMASHRLQELANIANKEKDVVKAAWYQKLAHSYDALVNVHQNELNKLAGYKLNTTIFEGLDKALLVENITHFTVDFINQSYTDGLADAIGTHYDEAAALVDDVLIFKTTIPNWVDSLIAKIGLNSKSLSGIAMKGFGLNMAFTLEYYAVEWFFREVVFEPLGLYENETYISLSDKIFGSLDSIKIGTSDFDAVSSVYALLQANARNTLDETQWARLFGSDEVRKMDMEMVNDVLKQSIKLVTGENVAVNNTSNIIYEVKKNYEAFKKVCGFDLLTIDHSKLFKNLKHERELYDEFYQQDDLGAAYRYALKNLNSFVIASNEKASGDYNGERFLADNEDALQYTTAAGEGYANAGDSSRYVTSLLLNLADELGDNSLLTFGKNLHQWNIVTNQKGVEVSAMDGDKTQFMLGNIGNDTLIGGNQNDIIIGKDGDDYIIGGNGSDQLYGLHGGAVSKLLTKF